VVGRKLAGGSIPPRSHGRIGQYENETKGNDAMSAETIQWLNTQTLIGFTDKRGTAWHYRAEDQGDESNHYPGAIPVDDVLRRLFSWTAVRGTLTATALTTDGVLRTESPDRVAIMRSDTGDILGIFKDSYQEHQYPVWILDSVAGILDDDLSIGSAGLLRNGGQAWVSVEVPDSITTPEGVTFRPNLLACTSHDGSLATTYQRVFTNTVCDNTMAIARAEKSERFKVKHSKYSNLKLADARDALAIVHTMADDFAAQVQTLCETTVTDAQWAAFLDAIVPVPTDEGRGKTMAENKRDEFRLLWNADPRVEPWKGTAYGVVQAVNTHTHHFATVRGAEGMNRNALRAERNMFRAVSGGVEKLDTETLLTLDKVLASV
jgi:phage/plasmid-like protein (TIGR03299 family)